MGQNQNWSQLGEQFKGAVNDALMNGNYNVLNDLVKDTVNDAIDEAKKQTKNAIDGISRDFRADIHINNKERKEERMPKQETYQPPRKVQPMLPQVKEVGKVAGILFVVFGGIGLGITALVFLIRLLAAVAGVHLGIGGLILFALFTGGFGYMIGHGCSLQARVRRAGRYAKLCGRKMYADIATIASGMGKSKKYVARDVQKMLELGMFPEGHMDGQGTCLMLSEDIYMTYVEAEKARKVRELEEKQPKQEEPPAQIREDKIDSELETIMQEGKDYIRKLRNLNDKIEGEVISAKLYKLEKLLKDIFWQLKQHPEKREQMQRFMEYYLPTTLKLVEAYADFDDVSEPGEDIVNAKAQIENTLDTINEAFAELLNNLFRDKVFDVTTDAQVLQTILSKDGLVKDDFVKNKE